MLRIFNWKKDLNDDRDLTVEFFKERTQTKVDLRSKMPPVYSQLSLGSCTANALAGAFEYDEKIPKDLHPSRLFIYYNERNAEGTTSTDSGASLRDGIKTMKKIGVCSEELWPYVVEKFAEKPSKICYDDAQKHKIQKYTRLNQNIEQFKKCLEEGLPFVFGILVYESFNTTATEKSGIIPMPNIRHEKLLGGHAILCAGFDDETGRFIFRNSWGELWGDSGYGYIPYEYLLSQKLSSDFWVIDKITI